MRQILINILSDLTYRLTTLIQGKISATQLENLLQKYIQDKALSKLDKLMIKAYARELTDFVVTQDLWGTKESDDPFLSFGKLEKYENEFGEIAKKTHYAPGGIIFSEAFLLYSLVRATNPQIFIESGTMNATSSFFIAEALKKNASHAKMFCLSLFENNEYETASQKLKPYDFVEIKVGESQVLIDNIIHQYAHNPIAFFIDGPKARSPAWNILMEKIATNFKNILFLCFDSMQDHVPYLPTLENIKNTKAYQLRRGINVERIKALRFYQKYFKNRNYQFFVPGNQFCRKYQYLNEELYQLRNKSWGQFFPWGPYRVDRIENHLAHSYKLGCIYKKDAMV